MTLLEEIQSEQFREASIPVLETKRLSLRAPRLEDAKTVAMLANDRRVAENVARIPHPYKMSDAETFIGRINETGEAVFLITLRDETVIGACGIVKQEQAAELGYWLGVPFWGQGYATEALHAVIDFAFTDSGPRLVAGRRPRHQPGLAPGAGEVRLPVDRRRPLPHPRHQFLGADRPLPAGARHLDRAQGLGADEARVVDCANGDASPRRGISRHAPRVRRLRIYCRTPPVPPD